MRRLTALLAAAVVVTGCSTPESPTGPPDADERPTHDGTPASPSSPDSRAPGGTPPRGTTPLPPASRPSLTPDPRWQFFTADRSRYGSPWFPGRHRVMIGYGCTQAPFYVPDARCDGEGFHHGVDVALPCGTPLLSGVRGRVVTPTAGAVGPAYGSRPLLLRTTLDGMAADVLVGHARRLLVRVGEDVAPGDPIAVTGDSAAPDGCHLHLEVREQGGDVTTARDPAPVLRLRAGDLGNQAGRTP